MLKLEFMFLVATICPTTTARPDKLSHLRNHGCRRKCGAQDFGVRTLIFASQRLLLRLKHGFRKNSEWRFQTASVRGIGAVVDPGIGRVGRLSRLVVFEADGFDDRDQSNSISCDPNRESNRTKSA